MLTKCDKYVIIYTQELILKECVYDQISGEYNNIGGFSGGYL